MRYMELIAKLETIERQTGVDLVDTNVDIENAGINAEDCELTRHAISAAAMRAEDAGLNINSFFDKPIY